jgi:hypothetical protein
VEKKKITIQFGLQKKTDLSAKINTQDKDKEQPIKIIPVKMSLSTQV